MSDKQTPNAQSPAAIIGWLDCLADPTRLRLLRLLQAHQLGVVELCQILQLPQSTVSRHLKLLTEHRWLKSRRKGTANLYRMNIQDLHQSAQNLWQITKDQTATWGRATEDTLRLDLLIKEKQKKSDAFFATAANQWLKTRTQLYGAKFSFHSIAALLPSHWTVADLGCGTGQVVAQLAQNVKNVIGVDRNVAMLEAAKKRLQKYKNVQLYQTQIEDLPIKDNTCNAAIMMLVLSYLQEPIAALKQAHRIIKPGGSIIIVDLQKHTRDDFREETGQVWLGFEKNKIQQHLKDAGLELTHYRKLTPEPQAKGPALFMAKAQVIKNNEKQHP